MKKLAFVAIAALTIAGCAKEVEAPIAPVQPKTYTVTITAGFDATKTAYDSEGKFSWVEGDKIGVLANNPALQENATKQFTFVAQASGVSVPFVGQVEEGYTLSGLASYPFTGEFDGYACNDFAWNEEDQQKVGGWRLWGSVKPSLTDPLASTPLLGVPDPEDEGNYLFHTATGIVKFTVENVPMKTYYAYLEVPEASKETYNLNGWYSLDSEASAIYMNAAVEPWADRRNFNVPTGENQTMDYYFFVPVGTLPAGTKFELHDSAWAPFASYEFKKDVEVPRNQVVNMAAITFEHVGWTSLGTGKFIDTYVWQDCGLGTSPVEVEIFYHNGLEQYKMANPYVIAAQAAGKDVAQDADEEFFFKLVEKGRISHDWLNMGLSLSKNTEKTWAMISGQDVAGYGSDLTHVVSYNADGSLAQVQLAPCYRTSDEARTGEPGDYANEIGKDHNNGIIEIVFPDSDLLQPVTIPAERISVSANQGGDGQGAPGLIDSNLTTYWHTPWSSVDENADPVYGQYVTVKLPEKATKLALSYCTRDSQNQNGAPAMVVVGGTTDGKTYTVIGVYELEAMMKVSASTWVGLPAFDATGLIGIRFGVAKNFRGDDLRVVASQPDEKWCNLAELSVWGVTTGEELPYYPDLEEGQVWVKADQVSVNSDAGTYDGTSHYDGVGPAGLVDFDKQTFWHSSYFAGYSSYYDNSKDFDPVYGVYADIALTTPMQDFSFSYYIRHNNANGRPREVKVAGSHDGTTWTLIATVADDSIMDKAAGARVDLPAMHGAEAYEYLRFGITKSGPNSDSLTEIAPGAEGIGNTALAELLLFEAQSN